MGILEQCVSVLIQWYNAQNIVEFMHEKHAVA